mgnify:FL=1
MIGLIKKIFGTKNDREVTRIKKTLVPQVYAYENQLSAMSDEDLRVQTKEWQEEI